MKLDKILGRILALTKQIFFEKPGDHRSFHNSFLTGGQSPFSLSGSIGLEWWLTEDAFQFCDEIANMSMSFFPELRGGDTASFSQVIKDVLKENALNEELFDSDKVFLMNANVLFDGRSVLKVKDFALKLWDKIYQGMVRSTADWIVLYPLYRVKGQSAALGFDGITLLSSEDTHTWELFCKRYSNARSWKPASGMRKEGEEFIFKNPPSMWLLCEIHGTESGARMYAGSLMRTFIAVLFSLFHDRYSNLLAKSMAEEFSYSTQFPRDGSHIRSGQTSASIGRLFPPLMIDLNISPEDITEIRKWYLLRSSASSINLRRSTTASHFIDYAIMTDDLERFIHFFIALDALFGEQDKVERTITDGIKRTFPGNLRWEERAKWLFDLRSELIHGGSSRIEDWKDFGRYRRYFKSNPLTDVGIGAMTGLRSCFTL
jgi:hypothetical protein